MRQIQELTTNRPNCWRAGRIWVHLCYEHNHSIWLETSSHDPAPDKKCRFWETAEVGKMEARGNAPERVENGNGRGSSRSSGGWGYRCRAPPRGLNFSLIWKKKGDRRSWVNMGSEQVQLKGRLNGRNRRSSDGVVSQRRQQRNYSTGWWMCQGLALQIAGGSATPKSRVIKIENHAHRL